MTTLPPPVHAVLESFRAEPSRTWSLIVTIYGDAIVPRGGSLWLGTLLDILAAFDIGDGVVRTAMSRLATDGLLERTRIGRNSFYRLAEKGRAAFTTATERIYFASPKAFDGRLSLAILDTGEDGERQQWSLEASGFGQLVPGVMIAPGKTVHGPAGAILLTAGVEENDARSLAARAWPVGTLARRYRRFVEELGPVADHLDGADALDGLPSLVVRTLLVHQYRRVILRDPLLPEGLLPPDWPGVRARRLCARIYRATLPASEAWLDGNARNEDGPLPAPDQTLAARFGDVVA